MMLQRLDLALGQHRLDLQRQAGPRHHVVNGGGKCDRQPHATMGRVCRHADPPAGRQSAISVGETRRGDDHPVLQSRRGQVARPVQGGEHVRRDAPRFGQDRLDHLGRRLGKARRRGQCREPCDVIKDKADVPDRSAIEHWGFSPTAWQKREAALWTTQSEG